MSTKKKATSTSPRGESGYWLDLRDHELLKEYFAAFLTEPSSSTRYLHWLRSCLQDDELRALAAEIVAAVAHVDCVDWMRRPHCDCDQCKRRRSIQAATAMLRRPS